MNINKTIRNGKLSISGVVGPMRNGDCKGSCGQICTSFYEGYLSIIEFAPGWNQEKLDRFLAIWDKWHLNDMQAGTPTQTDIIERHKEENSDWRYNYQEACDILESNGLLVDNGYKYGSAWLKVEVPQNIITWLDNLPTTDITPTWI